MLSIRLHLTVTGRPAAATYSTLADLGPGAMSSPEVRCVTMSGSSDRTTISSREVNFRRGVLRWGEADTNDAANHQIHFDGSWSCVDDGADTAVTFAARFDTGGPSRDQPLRPRAVRTLIDDTVDIVSGLFPGTVRVDDVVIQAHQPTTA